MTILLISVVRCGNISEKYIVNVSPTVTDLSAAKERGAQSPKNITDVQIKSFFMAELYPKGQKYKVILQKDIDSYEKYDTITPYVRTFYIIYIWLYCWLVSPEIHETYTTPSRLLQYREARHLVAFMDCSSTRPHRIFLWDADCSVFCRIYLVWITSQVVYRPEYKKINHTSAILIFAF